MAWFGFSVHIGCAAVVLLVPGPQSAEAFADGLPLGMAVRGLPLYLAPSFLLYAAAHGIARLGCPDSPASPSLK